MIEIVLDTNIYRADPLRRKAGFNALARLAKSGNLRLHIPYFVQGEFISQEIENYEKNVNEINNGISNLQRRALSSHLSKSLEELKKKFSDIQDNVIAYPEIEFSNWVKDINGVIHPVLEKHGSLVAKDYFDGAPPFGSKKSRNDIPDSFVWRVILDLAQEYAALFVVVADAKLHDACKKLPNVQTFSSLDEFISSDTCQAILQEESAKENIKRLYKYLPIIISLRGEDIEVKLIDILEGTNVQSTVIPNNIHLATIISIDELKLDISLENSSDLQYFGEGIIVIPFKAQMEVAVEYKLPILDFHSLSVKRTGKISVSKLDDYQYSAEEKFKLNITGNISVKVDAIKITDASPSDQDIRSLIDSAIFDIDTIDKKNIEDWDPIQNQWEQHFLDLVRFKQENGHCDVPRKHSDLGNWVNNQRQRLRQGKLATERINRLDAIGFTWKIRPRDMLEEYIDQLLDYQQIYGHLNVPQQDSQYKKLGRWLNDQRTNKTNGTLSKEYEDRLNEIGIVWNVLDANWDQRLGELKEFHQKYGHFNVSLDNSKEYPKLYYWTTKLRRNKPTEERLKKLKAIGYDWEKRPKKVTVSDWSEKLKALETFHKANGHFDIPYEENRSLYNWVYKLKKQKPSDEQMKNLQSIGYIWEDESKKFRMSWNENFNLLKEFHEINGHFEVSNKENPRLYKWVYKLKHKMPTNEHLRKLQAIGFNWESESKKTNQER